MSDYRIVEPTLVSSPTEIVNFMRTYIGEGTIWPHLIVTIRETMVAFVIGSAAGVVVGLALTAFPFAGAVMDPLLTFLNAMPRVALAPMFIIWFGIGETSKIALAVSLIFFIVLVSTQSGTKSVDREHQVLMRSLGASRAALLTKVVVPASVPSIFAGLRLAIVFSLVGVVFGEMLSAQAGLGQQLAYFTTVFNLAGSFGIVIVLAVFALVLTSILSFAERRLLSWAPEATEFR